jgi:hypothetical protein
MLSLPVTVAAVAVLVYVVTQSLFRRNKSSVPKGVKELPGPKGEYRHVL